MKKSILFTQCLQNDFVKPIGKYDQLPNLLHIGYEESTRLMGLNPEEGPVNLMMKWAYDQSEEELDIIHIRDWHDPENHDQDEHLRQFGKHCVMNTEGARFAFKLEKYPRTANIVESVILNDFIDTDLPMLLENYKGQKVRVGIMGVWTEAKITFLTYDLVSRYPNFDIAICSALTAGSSLANHYTALDHLQNVLGVRIISSIGEFTKFLTGDDEGITIDIKNKEGLPHLNFSGKANVTDADEKIIKYLFRNARSVDLKVLDGGYSGNLVLGSKSTDTEGREEAPHVLKIGPQEPIGQERMSFEKVEQVLGNSAPRITDFIDYKQRGGIKYRYASMGKGDSSTFQKLYESDLPLPMVKKYLDIVFKDQLGRFYRAKTFEKSNLLEYYMFDPSRAERLKPKIEKVLGTSAEQETLTLQTGDSFPNPYTFTRDELGSLIQQNNRSSFFAYCHGDLNGANIMIDGQENVWLIDFFHTHRGHILKDLLKLENDLLYIYNPMDSEEDLVEAIKLSKILFNVKDLAKPLPAVEETDLTSPRILRTYATLKILRSYYSELIEHDRDPLQAFIGNLRYSLHTLIFFESNYYHKKWALYNSGHFGRLIKERIKTSKKLRIDWLSNDVVPKESLGLTILPGRKDYSRDIGEDLKQLKKNGIDVIIPLLTDDEFDHFGVSELMDEYKEHGFEIEHLPIKDQLICSVEEINQMVKFIDKTLSENKKILIHCVGGLGRSGLVAASYLKYKGLKGDEAINRVRDVRGPRAVESNIQEDFVLGLKF